ncbi:unnamed protein product [Miscanthus lutarioriparius]|uniref:Uncharacterized protein n=1 Tax=Miscanthus lutarioriparius TaxID=422564 RepID=A0A811SEL1_9POAL|nr:unnamed protein product [Miscanthus lutarioriparius]
MAIVPFSLLSSTVASLPHLAAAARLLAEPTPDSSSTADAFVSRPRLRLGSVASRATVLRKELACSLAALPAPSTAAAVFAVAALLNSADGSEDLLLAVAALATFASSDVARLSLTQEAGAMVPRLCCTLESGSTAAEHVCMALLQLRMTSRDASADVAVRGGVVALLAACASDTPATQAPAAGVLRNLARGGAWVDVASLPLYGPEQQQHKDAPAEPSGGLRDGGVEPPGEAVHDTVAAVAEPDAAEEEQVVHGARAPTSSCCGGPPRQPSPSQARETKKVTVRSASAPRRRTPASAPAATGAWDVDRQCVRNGDCERAVRHMERLRTRPHSSVTSFACSKKIG